LAERLTQEGPDFLRQSRLYPGRSRSLAPALRAALISDFDRLGANGLAGTAAALVVAINQPERLAAISAPTPILTGERTAEGDADPDVLVKRLKHGRTRSIVLADAGFAVPAEQPDEFADAVIAFAESAHVLRRPAFVDRHRHGLVLTIGSVVTAVVAAGAAF